MNYKLIIYANKLYKEFILKEDTQKLTIGTRRDCQIWLDREMFRREFSVTVQLSDDAYILSCGEETYLSCEEHEREQVHPLTPGDRLALKESGTGAVMLYLDYSIDFGEIESDFRRCIHTGGVEQFTIGGAGEYGISVEEGPFGGDYLILTREGSGYRMDLSRMRFGVEVNGILVKEQEYYIEKNQFLGVYGTVFLLNGTDIYTTDAEHVRTSFASDILYDQVNQLKYPEFIRSARLKYIQPTDPIEVLMPDTAPTKPKENLLMTVLPSFIMMIVMIMLRSMMTSRKIYALYFGVMMGMSIIITIINHFRGKKEYRERTEHRLEVYNDYINRKDVEIAKERDEERTIAWKMNRSIESTLDEIDKFEATLFSKKKEDIDFLDLAIGTGTIEAVNQVKFREKEHLEIEDQLMNYPEMLHDKYEYLDGMPIILRLSQLNGVGFVGVRGKLYQMMQNMLISLAARHYYNDVKFYLIVDEEDADTIRWARWLRNLSDHGIRNISYNDDSKKVVLDQLYNELSNRAGIKKEALGRIAHEIIFVYRSNVIKGHPINNFVKDASAMCVTFLFFEEYQELMNEDVDKLIFLDREKHLGVIQETRDAVKTQGFTYEQVDVAAAASAAIKLAPVYVSEISLESTMTKNISLYQLLGIYSAYDLDLEKRWAGAAIYETMAAPIGVDNTGEKVYLDIHEKGHGPHGLVAGTTGSGKSELLQTYVLSLCSLFHPYEVGIIIIDFKGGGMANQFRNLPHMNGAITNIDGKQIDRSLMSIRAELMKRQRLFAEHDVNRIDDYIDLYKKGTAKIPLPHLLLIVDEFAELKSDQPEFMKELVSTARIGRSLGVHMILATQKPSGVVTDQIWSNSRFKLCLKVQDKQDSNEVLKSPLAAEIREPGRCYLEVGNMESFQLLQSAYSGAPAGVGSLDQRKAFDISVVNLAGRKQCIYHQEPESEKSSETQLDALVAYIAEYCEKRGIERLPEICLAPLAEKIPYPIAEKDPEQTDIIVPIGIYDDPSNQLQEEISLNLTRDNTFIIGSSLSGKTNYVQTVLRGIAERYTPEEVAVYIIDFGSMILRNFTNLGHVGGVVTVSEDTKLNQLLDMTMSIIEDRKQIFAEMGLSSFSAYLETGQKGMPQIVLLLENYTALKNAYPEHENIILDICREGSSVGVSVLMTNAVATGVGFKLMTNFSEKIALYCNDSSQYSIILDRCRLEPDNTAGRGVVVIDKEIREFQTYLAFDAEKEMERVERINAFVAASNERYGGKRVKQIPTIPEEVTADYLQENFGIDVHKCSDYRIPLGMRYDTVKPVFLDLSKNNLHGFSGQNELGRRDYLLFMLRTLEENREQQPVEIYIIDDLSRELSPASEYAIVKGYATGAAETAEYLKAIFTEAKARYDSMADDPDAIVDKPLTLLLMNTKLAEDMVVKTQETAQMYDLIINKLTACKVGVMLTNVDNVATSIKTTSIIKQLVEKRRLIMFEDAPNIKISTLPLPFVRANGRKLEYGGAYYMNDSELMKVKVVIK